MPTANTPLPADYAERVYAGVLGKIIGVYLGRPIEGMTHDQIIAELGEIDRYVHQERGVPLVVTDDDISGTFTFLRALEDYGYDPNLSPEAIGQTWLNYIIEKKTVLWWGGVGMSTEHTAFQRLKDGIKAPESGSVALNGQVVAEQIGAQIFIDGWGLINPGDHARAAEFARRAASVSHDGEAIYGAQVIAAMVAHAFVESDIDRLLDTAVSLIPSDSMIARLIADIRKWHANGEDWRQGFRRFEERYGYKDFGGGCHIVPNHAQIIHALLHGAGDFDRSLMIVNTCGWDTDCNSGNVGCILGVRNGLAGIGAKWRYPVRDRIFLPSADGGRAITDAVQEAGKIVDAALALRGQNRPGRPRFDFSFPGSVQGFRSETARLSNPDGAGLQIECDGPADALTPTFVQPKELSMKGYGLMASPTLNPGQRLRIRVRVPDGADAMAMNPRLITYGGTIDLPAQSIEPGCRHTFEAVVPGVDAPIHSVGVALHGRGAVIIEEIDWTGVPELTYPFSPSDPMARQAWIQACDEWPEWGDPFRVVQNSGRGMLITGCREWDDYEIVVPTRAHLADRFGIAVRVQGQRRYYALLLDRSGMCRLVKVLDGELVLAEAPLPWLFDQRLTLRLRAVGTKLTAWVDDRLLFECDDAKRPLLSGGIALIVDDGAMFADSVTLRPAG